MFQRRVGKNYGTMKKEKRQNKQSIIASLIAKVNRMPINRLHATLKDLDRVRYLGVVNCLHPQKFKELVIYDKKHVEFSSIWLRESNTGIKRALLDALDPIDLIHIGSQHQAGTVAWGTHLHPMKLVTEYCPSMSRYFFGCSVDRMKEIITFLVDNTKGVRLPRKNEEQQIHDIFVYTEGVHFPFEVIHLFASAHPRFLFPALAEITHVQFDRIMWLVKCFCGDSDSFDNVFDDTYDKYYSGLQKEDIAVIVKAAPSLDAKRFYKLLQGFRPETQRAITLALGEKYVIDMHTKVAFSPRISIPSHFKIFPDKITNDSVLKDLLSHKKTLGKLSSKKTAELLGELIT